VLFHATIIGNHEKIYVESESNQPPYHDPQKMNAPERQPPVYIFHRQNKDVAHIPAAVG